MWFTSQCWLRRWYGGETNERTLPFFTSRGGNVCHILRGIFWSSIRTQNVRHSSALQITSVWPHCGCAEDAIVSAILSEVLLGRHTCFYLFMNRFHNESGTFSRTKMGKKLVLERSSLSNRLPWDLHSENCQL